MAKPPRKPAKPRKKHIPDANPWPVFEALKNKYTSDADTPAKYEEGVRRAMREAQV